MAAFFGCGTKGGWKNGKEQIKGRYCVPRVREEKARLETVPAACAVGFWRFYLPSKQKVLAQRGSGMPAVGRGEVAGMPYWGDAKSIAKAMPRFRAKSQIVCNSRR